ncbi:MAG: hypothetical protein ISR85_02235 [Kiritimatiellales bacterium]|nr:hypothetical protein [Kiritimatiellota bacterium]MBL7011732.1 hypothetical protein [Kiritimatiellales bacterium]
MKPFVKFALLAILLSALFGCANSGEPFEVRLAPPDTFNPVFMRYKERPGEKVIVVAVDPGGSWAFGYDHSRDNLQEAAMNAAMKCDKAREKHKVFTKAKIFAINDEVVYYDQFK